VLIALPHAGSLEMGHCPKEPSQISAQTGSDRWLCYSTA